ncbi:hypothetical protein [Microbulbifer yueqingensis]|uniref:Competence protein CoiA-like family protein n=1 Tax=Microbulbifer yueqingensis TaxID=658219 RepID=A0A1G9EG22_9GAMM|nr:hypothetical protein [Microbulbifer yueqingensis]SDK75092.1 hypothetical protein SAMN05216212_3110 [Microbulbifer yueqingensis]
MESKRYKESELRWAVQVGSGKWKHVDEVPNGQDCNCVCPGCEGSLIACHPKAKIDSYFRHDVAVNSEAKCTNPQAAQESIVHMLTKQLLSEQDRIRLIPKLHFFKDYKKKKIRPFEVAPSKEWKLCNARTEDRSISDKFTPDVVFDTAVGLLAIEVKCTHRIDDIKRTLIAEAGIHAVELDVSDLSPSEVNIATIQNRLLSDRYTHWIEFPLTREGRQKIYDWHDEEFLRIEDELAREQSKSVKSGYSDKQNSQSGLASVYFRAKYRVLISQHILEKSSQFDSRHTREQELSGVYQLFAQLKSKLDDVYPNSKNHRELKRLDFELRKQINNRGVVEKNALLQEMASDYISSRADHDIKLLCEEGFLGEEPTFYNDYAQKDIWERVFVGQILRNVDKYVVSCSENYGLSLREQKTNISKNYLFAI